MAGLGTSGWNMEAILRCKEVLIWTDPDAAGEHGRQRLHSILDWMPDIRTLDIRSARDPKCYSLEKVQRILTIGGANV
jgi:5S rRNA maturation endonuclease (ribonuclease M5)